MYAYVYSNMLTPTGEHDSHYPSLHVLNILYIHRYAEAFTNRNRIYIRAVVADTQARLCTPWRYVNFGFFSTQLYRVIKESLCIRTTPTQFMIWRWPSQNTFGIWTVLYWTRFSRTQFGVSINVWRLAGDTVNITCNFLYYIHQVHRDFLITRYFVLLLWNYYYYYYYYYYYLLTYLLTYLLLISIEFSLGGSSPYNSTDKKKE
jgi:hypothetical protein